MSALHLSEHVEFWLL